MASQDSFGKRARKSIVAGLGAGLTAVGSTFVFTGAPTKDDVSKALGVFIVGFGVTAWATFKTRNAGSDIGPTGSTVR
jgi:fucose permease